ncbi:MAG: chemotaxis protein CheW [Candidatus Lambdaproteobacteria bacterium]|nr:chemotaxis protein CheW [Candidatus Lambdaproteobacteria bacterium]
MDLLLLLLDHRRFAIEAPAVQAVSRAVAVLALPKAPAAIEGIVDFRGTLAPLIDLRARFGYPPSALHPAQHLVFARAATRLVAFRADEVLGLSTVSDTEIEPMERLAAGSRYVSGVARLPNGLVLIHDLDEFLSHSESIQLEESLARLDLAQQPGMER